MYVRASTKIRSRPIHPLKLPALLLRSGGDSRSPPNGYTLNFPVSVLFAPILRSDNARQSHVWAPPFAITWHDDKFQRPALPPPHTSAEHAVNPCFLRLVPPKKTCSGTLPRPTHEQPSSRPILMRGGLCFDILYISWRCFVSSVFLKCSRASATNTFAGRAHCKRRPRAQNSSHEFHGIEKRSLRGD